MRWPRITNIRQIIAFDGNEIQHEWPSWMSGGNGFRKEPSSSRALPMTKLSGELVLLSILKLIDGNEKLPV
jgi:hypothetical protein